MSMTAFKRECGWHYLPLFSDLTGEFSRDYHALTKTAATMRRSTCSPGKMSQSGIFGAAR
jgi:predicted dithiol-disulfide oxidoreductase (DUF899 family)